MKNIFIILILIILFSCEKSDRKDLSNIDTTVVSDSINSDNVLSIEIREKAPAWFKSLPVKEGYIYAVGTAKSRRASIASDKALLNAQVSLAEELKQLEQGSGMEETQGADSDPDNENLSIKMQDVLTKNKKQIKSGNLWYCFVLLELKLDK
jgi:hypothetical protein